jgi:hypothetical protein
MSMTSFSDPYPGAPAASMVGTVPMGTAVPVSTAAGAGMPIPVVTAMPVAKPAQGPEPAFGGGMLVDTSATPRRESPRAAAPKSSIASVVMQLAMIVVIIVGAGFAFVLYQERQREKEAMARAAAEKPKPDASQAEAMAQAAPAKKAERHAARPARKPKPEAKAPAKPEEKPEAAKPAEKPKPEEKPQAKPEPKPDASVDPKKQKALNQALADAWVSLSEYDTDAARNYLDAAAKNVQNPNEEAQVTRLQTLAHNLDEFWKTIGKIVAGLEATEEIPIGDDRIVVVESGTDRLIIKAQGRMRQYSPLAQMPCVLATALADMGFAKDPQSKAVYGSYLAVAQDGDRQRARQLLQEASQAGVDVKDLLPLLDQASSAPGTPAIQKSPPPNDQTILEKTKAIKERFKADYDQATTSATKSLLAKKLLEAGRGTNDDPELRFAMLQEARNTAVSGGAVEVACAAIDQLGKSFDVDPLEMKIETMEEVGKSVRGLNSQKEIAQSSLPLLVAAVKADRLEEAKRLSELAVAAAQKSKSTSLLKQVRAVIQELEARSKGKKPKE